MDARTRHELKQNELAEALAQLRNLNDPRLRVGLLVVLGLAVVVAGVLWWRYNQSRTVEQSWKTLYELTADAGGEDVVAAEQAATGLRDLISKGGDPTVMGFAKLQLASVRVQQALMRADQRPAGFQEAVTLLTEIRSAPGTPTPLFAAATFALASALESLHEFDQARTLYTALANEERFAGLLYKSLATERLAGLDDLKAAINFFPGGPPHTVEPPPDLGAQPAAAAPPPEPAEEMPLEITEEMLQQLLQQQERPAPPTPGGTP
jgi:hypothetical protein